MKHRGCKPHSRDHQVIIFISDNFDVWLSLYIHNISRLSQIPKIPVISPGLIQLRKGFWVGL